MIWAYFIGLFVCVCWSFWYYKDEFDAAGMAILALGWPITLPLYLLWIGLRRRHRRR